MGINKIQQNKLKKFSFLENKFMSLALAEAKKAKQKDEVPVGAVIVSQNKVIARAHNIPISKNDATAHAEILAIQKAGKILKNYRLYNCDIYSTLEPCLMCAAAMIHARIKRLFFAAFEPKTGAIESNYKILEQKWLNHKFDYRNGLFAKTSKNLLVSFFQEKRLKNKQISS